MATRKKPSARKKVMKRALSEKRSLSTQRTRLLSLATTANTAVLAQRFKPKRINAPTIPDLASKLASGDFERIFLAEGDSWFDIFTPSPLHEPNLLDALETKWRAALVDFSRIGDKASQMVGGWQARNTTAMLDYFKFNALLLSAGGNDLKDAFSIRYMALAAQRHSRKGPADADLERMAQDPRSADEPFDSVIRSVITWIGFRDQSKFNRSTPIILHGYDYLQPRPAPARFRLEIPIGLGPWIYPILKENGQTSKEMFTTVKRVIDELNDRLRNALKPFANVHLIESRGVLTPAVPESKAQSNDWMDEIHPTPAGFAKLARAWNDKLEAVAI